MSNETSNLIGLPDASADGDASPPAIPYADATVPDHGRERNRRVVLAVFTSILIKPLSLIIPLVTVPLFLGYLKGDEGFGLYELIGSIAMYLGMTNLGLTMGLINKLIDCKVSGDRELARKYVSTLVVAMLAICAFTAVMCSVGIPLFNWRVMFDVKGDFSNRLLCWAIWTGGIVTVGNLMATLPHSIYFAEQELHRSNMWEGASKILTLLACVLIVKTNFGIIGVLLAVSGTPVFVRLINAFYMFWREKNWLRPSIRLFEWRLLKEILAQGFLLFLLGFAAVMLFHADKIIIGLGVSSAAVTPYAIVGKIYIAGYGVFVALLLPLWPASGEAMRRGDIRWVRRSLRLSLLMGCGTSFLVGVGLIIWRDPILHFIGRGQPIEVSRSVIAALACTFIVRAWVDCRSITLNATGVLVPQLIFYCGHAALNLIVAACVVHKYGVEGVAWSTPITAIFTSAWGYPWLMKKYIFSQENKLVPA